MPPIGDWTPSVEEAYEARRFSNFGPLSLRLEQRLADAWGDPETVCVVTSSGTAALAAALIAANPDQLVWGSDWPHPAIPQQDMPNDGAVLDALAGWVPDTALRNRILSGNPARLYGFDDDA